MKTTHLISILTATLLLCSCGGGNNTQQQNLSTVSSGKVTISVDESFKPIIEKEIAVFENKYVEAEVSATCTDEMNTIDLLLKDSVQLAITTRKLTESEKKQLESKKLFAREVKLAIDGIAIITNLKNSDTLISVSQLQQIMTGEVTKWNEIYPNSKLGNLVLVFDNTYSSTVRFAIDSICKGKPLFKDNVKAQKTNEEVIEYVSKTPNALGVIGVSWLGNKTDNLRISFINNVKLMGVNRVGSPNKYNTYQPFQAYLALQQYPLTRDVYAILTEPRNGLATGFLSFLCSDIGQRVILKEGIVPATQNVSIRTISIKDEY